MAVEQGVIGERATLRQPVVPQQFPQLLNGIVPAFVLVELGLLGVGRIQFEKPRVAGA